MEGDIRVLLVGHCGPDAFMLRRAVRSMLGTKQVEMINSADDLERELGRASLVLVNRVLDGRFDSDSGIELIRRLAGRGGARLMLVSNYADAQAEAVAAGAAPGFGKAEANTEQARRRLLEAIADSEGSADDSQPDQA